MAKIIMYKGQRLPTTARACHRLIKELIDKLEVAKEVNITIDGIDPRKMVEPFLRVPKVE